MASCSLSTRLDRTGGASKVPTADNLADLFTKSLARDPFTKLRALVLNVRDLSFSQITLPHRQSAYVASRTASDAQLVVRR